MKNRIFKNMFSSWAGFVVNIILAFLLSPFIVHKLGNVYYGIWVIVMQFTGYLNILDLGVRSSVVKYVSEYHANNDLKSSNDIISAAVSMYSIIGMLCLFISLIVAFFLPLLSDFSDASLEVVRLVVIIVGINVAQQFVVNVFYGILMGVQRHDIYNKVAIIFAFIRAGLIVFFLNYNYGIIALAIIQLFISLASNCFIIYFARKEVPYLVINLFKNKLQTYKRIFNYSVDTFLVNICQKISFQTDAMVIGYFLGAVAVTFYSIPLTLVDYMTRLVWSMILVLIPFTSELKAKNDLAKIRDVLHKGTKFSILVGSPICVIYLFMGKQFIDLWMGAEYAIESQYVLIVLALTHMVSLVHHTSRGILYGIAKHRVLVYCYVIEAIVNIVLSIILLKYFGILGVALGTAVPHIIFVLAVAPFIICRHVEQKVGTYLLHSVFLPFLPAVPFSVLCFFLNKYFPVNSLLYFFSQALGILPIYAFFVWFSVMSRQEKSEITFQIVSLLSKK